MSPTKSHDSSNSHSCGLFSCFGSKSTKDTTKDKIDESMAQRMNEVVDLMTPRNGVSPPLRFNQSTRQIEIGDMNGSSINWKPMPPRPEEIDIK